MRSIKTIADLLLELPDRTLLDVRSPAEFEQGHLVGAVSFPLFSNDERAEVGTIYKKQGPDQALVRGLEIVGPKMAGFVKRAAEISENKRLLVHCWRGGKRSQSMAWLLETAGFDVKILAGGYKNYRRAVLDFFEKTDLPLIVLGGKTGVGKTKILQKIAATGAQVIDLERLANHKGSAFGSLGEAEQPRTEHFENLLFHASQSLDLSQPIWVENESRSIGRVFLPSGFFEKMRVAPLVQLEIPLAERIQNLCADYANQPLDGLKNAFKQIEKKLGGQHFKAAIEHLDAGNMAAAAEIALVYYDKTYQHGLETSQSKIIKTLSFDKFQADEIAAAIHFLSSEKSVQNRV